MKFFLIMLFGLGTAVAADIYRWVDDNGNQVYSDEPVENAEKIELQDSMTYSPVQIPGVTDSTTTTNEQEESGESEVDPDYKLTIVAPEDDAGIRVNNGNVTVNLQLQPAFVPERGDKIQLYLDGLPAGVPMPQLSFMLENLDRGTHKLSAVVLNASGEVIAQSETTTFHLQRTSLLQPGRQQNNLPGGGAPTIPGIPTNPSVPNPN
ncbi:MULTISPECIES: DUF4124 domain-containing protein [unclassified Methylophaga]|jgi:hypothetical protein|uniref:DUF4124 domain-containing protein n=2 Tax=unclassified Methylophaga TaxID=2629249 RepID=UPI0025D64C1E|nr:MULTISPECIES: DUF4124 domain-containing protein [unclassified Methylophaga]|tara:strand:+ start:26700 stop:27320 length:621 start_codon:yes stop_codon:yes gene_type:complete